MSAELDPRIWKRIAKFDSDYTPCGCHGRRHSGHSGGIDMDYIRHTPVWWRAIKDRWEFHCERCGVRWIAPICTQNERPGGITPDHDYQPEVIE